jgi:hypothetical protein
VELAKVVDGNWTPLAGPVSFEAKSLALATLPASDEAAAAAFRRQVSEAYRAVVGATSLAGEARERTRHLRQAILDTPGADRTALFADLDAIQEKLDDLQDTFYGDRTIARRHEPTLPGLSGRINRVTEGFWTTSSAPTQAMRNNYRIVADALPGVIDTLRQIVEVDLAAVESAVEEGGGPWTPGRIPVFDGGE